MNFIYTLVIAVGELYLMIYLVKRKRYHNILNTGRLTTAIFSDKRLTSE